MAAPARPYAVGDRVRARHTLREMVVEAVYDPIYAYRYVCAWAAADGVVRRDLFRDDDLLPPPADGPRARSG